VDPVPDPLLLRKSGSAGESNPEPLRLQPGIVTASLNKPIHAGAVVLMKSSHQLRKVE
jgi:hypothetical protein